MVAIFRIAYLHACDFNLWKFPTSRTHTHTHELFATTFILIITSCKWMIASVRGISANERITAYCTKNRQNRHALGFYNKLFRNSPFGRNLHFVFKSKSKNKKATYSVISIGIYIWIMFVKHWVNCPITQINTHWQYGDNRLTDVMIFNWFWNVPVIISVFE